MKPLHFKKRTMDGFMVLNPIRVKRFLICLALIPIAKFADAQLIGNRAVGNTPGNIQQTSPGNRLGVGSFSNTAPGTGQIGPNGMQLGNIPGLQTGSPQTPGTSITGRFVRGNRPRGEFVGANRAELRRFVGASQAIGVGTGAPPPTNIRIETKARGINKPLPTLPKGGMYYPRLDPNFDDELEGLAPESIPSPQVAVDIQERLRRASGDPIQVTMVGGTAILKGQVQSSRTKELLETMAGFEPGVDRVRNELTVQPD